MSYRLSKRSASKTPPAPPVHGAPQGGKLATTSSGATLGKRGKLTKPRSVVPIPDTIESIRGYPEKLIIFKVPASPFWWVRYYDAKPIKRSAKTTDKAQAIKAAKVFYEELLVNKKLGISSNPRKSSFALCADAVIAEDKRKAERGELNRHYVKSQSQIIRKHIMGFFGRSEASAIGYAELDKFKTYLFDKKLAATSVKTHFVAVKKILDHAQRTGVIAATPLLPKVKKEDNARGFFTLPEYLLLRRTARRLVGSISEVKQRTERDGEQVDLKLRNIAITREVELMIPFMVYSFIRPTDLKNMKHRHLTVRKDGALNYLWMPLPESKGHVAPMTSMPRAAIFYRQLRESRLAQLGDPKADISDDYVFEPGQENRDYAYRKITRQFDVVLDTAGLRVSADGDDRTLYSLRHTSLMYRLRYGGEINPLVLAKNARTSVEMLQRFYLSKLETAHFTAELHAQKPSKRQRREKVTFTEPPQLVARATNPSGLPLPIPGLPIYKLVDGNVAQPDEE